MVSLEGLTIVCSAKNLLKVFDLVILLVVKKALMSWEGRDSVHVAI